MSTKHPRTAFLRTPPLGALGLAALLFAGCPAVEAPWARETSTSTQSEAAPDALQAPSAEALALEERQAEAMAAESAALEAAKQAAAEREQLLQLREEQLEREEALRREKARIEQARAEAEARQRQLAAKEKELENFEANLAFQEKELRDRETLIDETLEAMELPDDGAGEDAFEAEPVGQSSRQPGTEAGIEAGSDGPRVASLEPGRLLEIEFAETVSSATHRRGDEFTGRLVQDLTAEDGTLVVAAGARVIGRVTESVAPKKVGGRSLLEIEFTHLELPSGDPIAISASFVEVGADKRKDKKKIAGAAIVGAILGRVLGGDGAEGVLAGAAAGAAAGTVAVSRGEGREADIPKGQVVALQLEEVVTVEIEMTGPVGR